MNKDKITKQSALGGEALQAYIEEFGGATTDAQHRLRAATFDIPRGGQRTITPEVAQLLTILTSVSGAKNALEVGTFTGYSALAIALGLPEDGNLTCIDISDEHKDLAERAWQEAGVDRKINFYIDDARRRIPLLSHTFDLAFLDADKKHYLEYFEMILEKLRPGGLLIVDNTLWHGEVATESDNKIAVTLREFNETIANDSRVRVTILNAGDGISLIQKL